MSYKFLDHATDAIIEVTAKNLKEAFAVAADAEINLTLDQDKVEEKGEMKFSAKGKDLSYLLFSWLEEIPFILFVVNQNAIYYSLYKSCVSFCV